MYCTRDAREVTWLFSGRIDRFPGTGIKLRNARAIQALRLLAKPSMRGYAKSLADRAEEEARALARATGEEE